MTDRLSAEDIEALVADLRSLADCDARAGEPLGKAMRRAADQLTAAKEDIKLWQTETKLWHSRFEAAEAKLAAAVQALEEIAGYSILPFPTENGVSLNVTAAKLVYDAWAQSVQIARRALPPAAGGAE